MNKLLVISLVILITGCATAYQSQGMSGGFSETQLDTNVYTIRFNGNGYTAPSRAADFALLRSAELTLLNGYKYFLIIDRNSYIKQTQGSIPIQNYESGTISGPGGTARYSGYTTSYQNYTFNKPRAENTIVMLRERPTDSVSYNAQIINNSLTSKYGL